MSNETNSLSLDIILLGKEYRVACPPGEQEALAAAAAYVDQKMHEIASKTKNNLAERIAVMAALNIAHEYLSQKKSAASLPLTDASEIGFDRSEFQRRICSMEAELEAVLKPQDKLL